MTVSNSLFLIPRRIIVPVSEPHYEPKSRRPIAAVFRQMARGITDFCVRRGIHPDAISYLSIFASLLAAICFWQSGRWPILLFIAPGFCYIRLFLNMLDGMVALSSGKASPRGEILNDLPDRISDVLIFAGFAHSGLGQPIFGYWAIILALLTAYVGTLGQAVGARREFGGIMSKPWRMATLHAGAWITLGMIWFNGGRFRFGGLTVFDLTCLAVIAGCVQTIWVRLSRIMRTLRESGQRISGE
jgi:phosphatidylglycerophosphate synthase